MSSASVNADAEVVPRTRPPALHLIGVFALICAVYICLGPLARQTVFPEAGVSLVWLPSAFGAAMIARARSDFLVAVIPAVVAGEFLADIFLFSFSLNATLVFVVANIIEQMLVGFSLRRLGLNNLRRSQDVVLLVIVAVVVELVGASIGAFAGVINFGAEYWDAWRAWYLGSTTALVLVAPFFLTIHIPRKVRWQQAIEFAAIAAATIAISLGVFLTTSPNGGFTPFVALLAPMLGWLGIRFGIAAIAAVAPFVVYIAAVAAAHSLGPFEGTTPDINLLLTTQAFLVLVCLTMYAAAVIEGARRKASAAERDAIEALERQATHDSLTDLPNRYALTDRLNEALSDPLRPRRIAVLYGDLDGFKLLNDAAGHTVGDEVLKGVAQRMLSVISTEDMLARVGGDEFVLVCTDATTDDEIQQLTHSLRAAVCAPFVIGGQEYVVGISFGVAVTTPHDEFARTITGDELVRRADLALSEAKRVGENRTELYRNAMAERVQERISRLSELRSALADDRIEAWFEVIVDPRSGLADAASATPWVRHSDGSVLPPADFQALAETSGLSVEIGRRVRELAFRWLVDRNSGSSYLRVAVGISARELVEPDFADSVRSTIAASGIRPGDVILEVPEPAITGASPEALAQLRQLREEGMHIAIDDFGTGLSSLSTLRTLPADIVKIDQGAIRDILSQPDERAIVASLITFGHELGKHVVATGVENLEQASTLTALGCDLLQGTYYRGAVPASEFRAPQFPPTQVENPIRAFDPEERGKTS